MKRSTFITWDQLKVGALIVVGLSILGVAIVRLGQSTDLFESRYPLVTFVENAGGLRAGGQVLLAGLPAGVVEEIDFLPVDRDTLNNIRIVMRVNKDLAPQIRENSTARIRTLGLLGDKVIDISPGTPAFSVLEPGDTVPVTGAVDYDQVIAQAAGAVGDVVQLTRDLRLITGNVVRGEGTLGQLLVSRDLYDELTTTLTETNELLVRLQNPNGTFGRLVEDPLLYLSLVSAVQSLDSVLEVVTSRRGTVGKLLYSDSLYMQLTSAATAADTILSLIAGGEGTLGRLVTEPQLYERLLKVTVDLEALLEDVRRNPQKYTRGLIRVF